MAPGFSIRFSFLTADTCVHQVDASAVASLSRRWTLGDVCTTPLPLIALHFNVIGLCIPRHVDVAYSNLFLSRIDCIV